MKKLCSICLIAVMLFGIVGISGCQSKDDAGDAATDYDVIVVGGEPEGVAAAVSAARNGLRTLLVEDDDALGGLMTLGELNFIDMCEGRDGTLLTQGIFEEFYQAVGGTAFDIEKAKNVFMQMAEQEKNLTVWLNCQAEPIVKNQCVEGIRISGQDYSAGVVIDATADADFAAASGVPYTFGGEDIGEKDRQMGVTLVFTLGNVDWEKVTAYLENDDNAGTGATDKAAWGYSTEGYAYEPKDEMLRMRGINAARMDNGDVLINALIIFGVDVLDAASKAEGIARGQSELAYIVPYMQQNFVGFEQATLISTAPQLYVRESRHVIGEYQLTIDDVLENRDQWDKIAIGGYPVDVQPTATQRYGTVIGSPDRYAIPYRCIVPLEIENLLVVGRSASYTSLAAGSARVIPIGMACGEAAGTVCAYAKENNRSVRDLCGDEAAMQAIQKMLKKQGAYLDDFQITEPIMFHWAYEGVKTLRSLGLLDGGYSNEYHLDVPIGKWKCQNMLNRTLAKAGIQAEYQFSDTPSVKEVIGAAADAAGCQATALEQQLTELQNKGILDEELRSCFVDEDAQVQVAECVMLAGNLYHYLVEQ